MTLNRKPIIFLFIFPIHANPCLAALIPLLARTIDEIIVFTLLIEWLLLLSINPNFFFSLYFFILTKAIIVGTTIKIIAMLSVSTSAKTIRVTNIPNMPVRVTPLAIVFKTFFVLES